MSRGTTWTEEQRNGALDAYRANGAAVASQQTGIPAGTIRRWASESGERTQRAQILSEAIGASRQRWEERRLRIVHDMGEVAELALQKCKEGLDDGKNRDAQAAATTLAILVDKAQLLSGAPTSRPNVDPGTLLNESRGKALSLVPQRKAG